MTALERHYEIIGRILVHMASIGLKRIEFLNHETVIVEFGSLTDNPREDSEAYQDVLEWMFAEGLLRRDPDSGGSKRAGVFVFGDVQLTAKGIAVIERDLQAGLGIKRISQAGATASGDLTPGVYVKIGSLVGAMIGGFTKSLS